MSRRVQLRRTAEDDIDDHFLFIAEESVAAATRFFDAARDVVRVLHASRDLGRALEGT